MPTLAQHQEVSAATVASRKVGWYKYRKGLAPYLWLLPSFLLILLFTLYPVYQLFVTSFSKMDLAGISHGFTGLSNYVHLIQERNFAHTISNTIVWTVSIVGLSTIISLGVSVLLNLDFPGRKFVRAALIVPWAASLLITASIWKWIFDYNYGTLNLILKDLNIIHHNIYWLATYHTSFPAMIWIGIFVTIPFTTFVFLAGLQTIPSDLYEAASVDGARPWRKFWHITLPSLRHSLIVSTVLNTIYVFNSFPIIWTVTQGGPANSTQTLITYLYSLAFQVNNMGEAAAASVISFVLLLVFSIIYGYMVLRSE
ncbi:MAG: sugar ABC transporter permease [Alicyclobacillus macrosporangiidus]|uniref:carbohydrate ABC transporter permease n=1 Tax=Alicyclobacillus macrosporangiidus TaxID=392015 RepID=UPI0026F05207|nr:sugar ABC transporter permease [Alicyclobacillus macrosporangiidus]MCL6600400.1 sugar ABC transporter permease [Alicyclobacillus macrosporangiidus]